MIEAPLSKGTRALSATYSGVSMLRLGAVLMTWACIMPLFWTVPNTLVLSDWPRALSLLSCGLAYGAWNTLAIVKTIRWLTAPGQLQFLHISRGIQWLYIGGSGLLFLGCKWLAVPLFPEDVTTWFILGVALVGIFVGNRVRTAMVALVALIAINGGMEWWQHGGFWASRVTMVNTCGAIFMGIVGLLTKKAIYSQWVLERTTRELELANKQLAQQAADSVRLAIWEERHRLAREIHDAVGHSLTVVGAQLQVAEALAQRDDVAGGLEAVTKARMATQQGLEEVRRSTSLMLTSPLDYQTLQDALQALVAATRLPGRDVTYTMQGSLPRLPPLLELTLYRAAQEGLTNALRHSGASQVQLLLDATHPRSVSMVVYDNGQGMPADSQQLGKGLRGLRERADQLRGSVDISSPEGAGCVIKMTLPLPAGHD